MELQQLRYFRVAAETQHVTKAAEKLFVSQSAVSRAITQLEEELGVALFHRQGRSILLSASGKQFLAAITQVQNALDCAVRAVKETTDAETGTVVCGFLGSLGAEMVPRLVESYRRVWPKVQFTLIQRSGEALLSSLLEGSIDLCLSSPGVFDNVALTWHHLLDEVLVMAVPKAHRLATRKTVALKDFREDPFLALSAGRTLRAIFDKACQAAEVEPKIAFEAMDLTTLRGMAAAGLGVALLTPSSSRYKGLVELELSKPKPVRSIAIAHVTDRYLPPCAENFLLFAEKFFADSRSSTSRQ